MSIDLPKLKQFVHQQPCIQMAVEAMESLQPHFDSHLTAQPEGATNSPHFKLTLYAHPVAGGTPMPILILKFYPERVDIPNMILPPDLHRRGAMIGALGRMTETARQMKFEVNVVDLVGSQHQRLIRRGAHQLPRRDEVRLHVGMDFTPSSGPSS